MMFVEDSKRGKSQFLQIDSHPLECALVVTMSSQPLVTKTDGKQHFGEAKKTDTLWGSSIKMLKNRIRVHGLDSNTNIAAFTKEFLDKVGSIVPISQASNVEQLLFYLQKRDSNITPNASKVISQPPQQQPSMEKIPQYIELMYEDIPEKINATRSIMLLSRDPSNMEIIMKTDSLIQALTRTLREDVKKSTELVTNILNIFFSFSNFHQYHVFITANKIGDMTLKIIEQEISRYKLWMTEALTCGNDKGALEYKKISNLIKKQEQLLFVCVHLLLNLAEDISIEVKMVKRGIVASLLTLLDRKTSELIILVLTFIKKLVVFEENKTLLLNDADSFLIKMNDFIVSEVQGIKALSLKIVYNLSFDQQFRRICIRQDYISKLFLQWENHDDDEETCILQLLYMLSVEPEAEKYFGKPQHIQRITRKLPNSRGNVSFMALVINISFFQKCAEAICNEGVVSLLMGKAIKEHDVLMLKMMRNIARMPGDHKLLFLDFIDELMQELLKSRENPSIFVELLGICSSLNIADFDFAKLIETFDLIKLFEGYLVKFLENKPANKQSIRTSLQHKTHHDHFLKSTDISPDDDVLLEIVIWIGTVIQDDGVYEMFAQSRVIDLMIDLMSVREEDDEIILQTLYALNHFLANPKTANIVTRNKVFVTYLVDLLYDRNVEIRNVCDASLDIISEQDASFETKIKQKKFIWHNSEWLSQHKNPSEQPIISDNWDTSTFSNVNLIEDFEEIQSFAE